MTRGKLALLLALAAGCASRSSFQKHDLGGGSFQLDCAAPLSRCSEEADRVCDGRGFDVVEGHDQRKLLGHAAGESQVEVRKSRLVVVCRDARGESPTSGAQAGPQAPKPALVAPPPATAASRALLCTPGTTQRCVGPGACDGGQSCLADGSGFGACDCGKAAPAAPSPPTSSP